MEGFGITTESRLGRWTQPVKSSGVDQEDLDRSKCLEEYCMEYVYYKRAKRNVWNLQNEIDYFNGSPEEMVKLENELKEARADFGERKARRVNDERRFVIEPKARLKVVKKKVTFSDEVDFDLSRKSTGTFREGAENVPNPLFWLD